MIDSLQNPKYKHILKLQKPKFRREQQQVWVEGFKEVHAALKAGLNCAAIVVPQSSDPVQVLSEFENFTIPEPWVFGSRLWAQVAYRETETVAALFDFVPASASDVSNWLGQQNSTAVIIDGVEKPGNVGAILRSAEACGVQVVLRVGGGTDFTNPNVIRASLGTVFSLRCASIELSTLAELVGSSPRRFVLVTPESSNTWRYGDLARDDILIFGSEAKGVSAEVRAIVQDSLSLPMAGNVNSINVAQCATVLMYDQFLDGEQTAKSIQ